MIITVLPPVVQPSLGEIALMQGTADDGYRPEKLGNCQEVLILFALMLIWSPGKRPRGAT